MLGKDEALSEDIASDMDPEDDCLSVMNVDDEVSTTAFTTFDIENADLKQGRISGIIPQNCANSTPRYLADGYTPSYLPDFLANEGTKPVISPNPRRLVQPAFNAIAYRARILNERDFCCLKDWRAIATRYDKIAPNFVVGICLAVFVTN